MIEDDDLKRCSKCRQRKPPSDFGRHPKAKDGKQSRCKRCFADYQKERRKDPALKAIDRDRINRAMAKRQDYYDELHNEARRRRRQNPEYTEQERAYARSLYARVFQNDPDYQALNKARAHQWRVENQTAEEYKLAARTKEARRRSLKTVTVSGDDLTSVLMSGPCVYCGAPATTVDHVTPLARGGHHAVYNLVPACGTCNSSKGAKLLADWNQARVTQALACSLKVCAQFNLQRPQLV